MRGWLGIAAVALALATGAATADTAPQVVTATPGGARGIERFTARFSEAMVPLGDPRAASPFRVDCPVAGQGRWVDQQTYVWEFARPLPGGLSCSFTLPDEARSLRRAALGGQKRFLVDTGGPTVRAVLPDRYDGRVEEDQVFLIATNVAADRGSVAAGAYCAVDGIGEKIPVDLLAADLPAKLLGQLGGDRYQVTSFLERANLPTALPKDAAARTRALSGLIALKCRRPLPPGREMSLVWGAAIRAAGSSRTAGADQSFPFEVRPSFEARFECARVNAGAGCNPVLPATVRFTGPVARDVAAAVRLEVNGEPREPEKPEGSGATVETVTFKGPFPEAAEGRVVLPENIRDESGRALVNARRFPLDVRFDAAPPLVKFAAPFGILEVQEGGILPVTVRNVEPALAGKIKGVGGATLRVEGGDGDVARWLRRIDEAGRNDFREEKNGADSVTVNHTGATSVFTGADGTKPLEVALPGKGRQFEVVGIPLAKPGFYVVELASPRLGEALLGRKAPRYVAAGALVTNMAVHFKWGRGSSLAWVTALDSGRPVAGAEVQLSDSCTGRAIARGATDAMGRLRFTGAVPPSRTYGDCDRDESHPLMVSARKGDDFSFALTEWGEGLSPYDFDLSYGYEERPEIFHTVFDRTLMRAGDTINMKHLLRRQVADGFANEAIAGTLKLMHRGSGTAFEQPVTLGADGIGESRWTAPRGAPMGDYDVSLVTPERTIFSTQSLRVDEYRLPTMRASVSGPKGTPVRPKAIPLDLFVGYLSGGGASNLGVTVRAAFMPDEATPKGWDGWAFGGPVVKEGTVALDGDNREPTAPIPPAQTVPVSLDGQGAGRTTVPVPQAIEGSSSLLVEMDYPDANGEMLTASRRIALAPSAVRVAVKTDGWMMKEDDLRLKLAVIDLEGRPVKGRRVTVALYSREILSARRRLIGGFYAYDNSMKTTLLDEGCTATTDAQGLAECAIDPGVSGEVYAVATAEDDEGRESRAARSVWLAGGEDWWFGGDNGDRMDLVPEQKEYRSGETARFQVRMPFRSATALVTVEREGVLSSFVTELSGKDPVVSVKLDGRYAPDVHVSVLAVRGRVSGWRLWLADLAREWHLPFLGREGARPTALVDLAKPSFRLGIAKVDVGWEANRLDVGVKADRETYRVRDVAQVAVQVREPGGGVPRSAEIAFAAVDEALLQLQPNESWKLLDAMMVDRPLSVLTSTAQTQVVGKRHYGRKALAAGGGGGGDMAAVNREDFRPVLLWRGRVPLDAQGRARVAVPLSDALSAFRLVAVASAGANRFGQGETTVRTTQDLTIYAGLPPVVRNGDRYGATFTLRNGTDRPMAVTATATTFPRIGTAPPIRLTIPAHGAAPVTWNVVAPQGAGRIGWTVNVAGAGSADRVTATQQLVPLVPLETWAATVARVGPATRLMVAPPAGALPGRGQVEVRLSDTLAPPLAGVRAYMADYPWNCLEQQLSRAVVVGDEAGWARLVAELPAYLDAEGLARYFPQETMRGSEALTAYLLSISAEAGWALPAEPKARMIEALRGVVDGRVRREGMGSGDARFQRLASVAALARQGAATPDMLGRIGLPLGEMPTALLADWIAAADRLGAAGQRQAGEAELRKRLVYEGSRLDLSDDAAAPWWMMTSGDESAIRALVATLGKPGWQEESPRMMVGVALRQRRGHWDTTPANAWGTIAARRFAATYPPGAVTGTTTLAIGPVRRTQGWPAANPLLMLPLPASPAPLQMAQAGSSAGPWAQVRVVAAVPLARPLFAGYRVTRAVSVVSARHPGRLTRGDVLKVRLTVEASAERNWVVVADPIPAGATIVGTLGGQSTLLRSGDETGGDTYPSYVERAQEGFRAYYEWVPRGRFTVEYAVRLNGAGRFSLPPTRVEAMYSPEIHAAVPNAAVTVAAR